VAWQGAEEHHTLDTGSRGKRKLGRAGRHAHGSDDPVDYGKDIHRAALEATPSPGAEDVAQGVGGVESSKGVEGP